jgi:hypothetical protein
MVNSPAGLVFALSNLTISNLMAWTWRLYVGNMSPLNINIITYLNQALIQTYNIFISLICSAMIARFINEEVSRPLFLLFIPLNIFALSCVEFILIGIAVVRLLFVFNYIWMSRQEYEQLGKKILVCTVLISTTITIGTSAAVITVRSKDQSLARQWFNIIQASIFLLANMFVMVSYLACSLILNRQRTANMSICIGESSSVKTPHLLRMRPLFLGNMLALITATVLLVVTILPTPFYGNKLRTVELQVHVLIMLYYSSQVKLGVFLKWKIVQILQPYRIWWGRQTQRAINPYPLHPRADVAIEMGELTPGQAEPGIFVISNPNIPSGINTVTFIEDSHAAQATKSSLSVSGEISNSRACVPDISENSISPVTEDYQEEVRFFTNTSESYVLPNANICSASSTVFNMFNGDSNGAIMGRCAKPSSVMAEENDLDSKEESPVVHCNGNSCRIYRNRGASGANRTGITESEISLFVSCETHDEQTNGGGSSENQIYPLRNDLMQTENCSNAALGEPLKSKAGVGHQITTTLQIHQPDVDSSGNNFTTQLFNKKHLEAKNIIIEGPETVSDDIHTSRPGDDLNEAKKSSYERKANLCNKEVQIIHQTDNILTISTEICSVADEWGLDQSKLPSKTASSWFVDEDLIRETASQLSEGNCSVERNRNECEDNQDSEDVLSDGIDVAIANDNDNIHGNAEYDLNKTFKTLLTKSAFLVHPHVSNLPSLTQLSLTRGHLEPKASTAWTSNVKADKKLFLAPKSKVNPSSETKLAARKLYGEQKLKSSFSNESGVSPVIEMDRNLYEDDDVDEFSQSYGRIQQKGEVDTGSSGVNLPGEICTSPQL